MPLSMRVPSVAPCGAVPWVPSSIAQRGNGIGETHEEGGKLHLVFSYASLDVSTALNMTRKKKETPVRNKTKRTFST